MIRAGINASGVKNEIGYPTCPHGPEKAGVQKREKRMTGAGLDPATSSVLTRRDNQLRQPANLVV